MSPPILALCVVMLLAGGVLVWLGIHFHRNRPAAEPGEADIRGWCLTFSAAVALPGVALTAGSVLLALSTI